MTILIFPVADGTVRTLGGIRRLKTTTFFRDRPERGEEQGNILGKLEGLYSPNPLQDDSTRDDAEAKNDLWSITGDFILSTSRGTQSQNVHAERGIISYSAEVHPRCQNHSYIT